MLAHGLSLTDPYFHAAVAEQTIGRRDEVSECGKKDREGVVTAHTGRRPLTVVVYRERLTQTLNSRRKDRRLILALILQNVDACASSCPRLNYSAAAHVPVVFEGV